MKTRRFAFAAIALLAMLFAACNKDTHIHVDESQLVGRWVKSGTQEYWRYNTDRTGVTWDESEDITEEESNLTYTWSIDEDVLTHIFRGAMDNQAVPKVYTIKEITSTTMRREDDYGLSYTLIKADTK